MSDWETNLTGANFNFEYLDLKVRGGGGGEYGNFKFLIVIMNFKEIFYLILSKYILSKYIKIPRIKNSKLWIRR